MWFDSANKAKTKEVLLGVSSVVKMTTRCRKDKFR